jgi:hypothetical protein
VKVEEGGGEEGEEGTERVKEIYQAHYMNAWG